MHVKFPIERFHDVAVPKTIGIFLIRNRFPKERNFIMATMDAWVIRMHLYLQRLDLVEELLLVCAKMEFLLYLVRV